MAGPALGACSFTGWLIHRDSHNSGTGWVCPDATPSNLMSVVRCGGGLWCRYNLCWAVIVPLRLSMSAYGGVKLFIELGINEATN
eukprot:91290-Pelagomonas_calceolata.AAC.1